MARPQTFKQKSMFFCWQSAWSITNFLDQTGKGGFWTCDSSALGVMSCWSMLTLGPPGGQYSYILIKSIVLLPLNYILQLYFNHFIFLTSSKYNVVINCDNGNKWHFYQPSLHSLMTVWQRARAMKNSWHSGLLRSRSLSTNRWSENFIPPQENRFQLKSSGLI